jgi:hypothetical protein
MISDKGTFVTRGKVTEIPHGIDPVHLMPLCAEHMLNHVRRIGFTVIDARLV